MLAMLIAYNAAGEVVGSLDYLVQYDEDGNALGLVDFGAHEKAGGEHTDIWRHSKAVGSKVWPEWLGHRVRDFRVERDGPPGAKRITALVHKTSGRRRSRAKIERAIADRIIVAHAEAIATRRKPEADIRDLVGGPDAPLRLDDEGRTKPKVKRERPKLPLVRAK